MMVPYFFIEKFCLVAVLFTTLLPESQESSVLIRVKNSTRYTLKNLDVNSPPSDKVHFGRIDAGQKSDYKKFSNAYRIAGIIAEIDGKKVEFLPDDYLGEQLLKPGTYTYEITVLETPEKKHLRLKFIVD